MKIKINIRKKIFLLGDSYSYFEEVEFYVRDDSTYNEISSFLFDSFHDLELKLDSKMTRNFFNRCKYISSFH